MRCLVALVLLTGVAFAQSQQPPAQTGQQNTAQQERGTDKSPVIVKVLPTEKSKDDLAREDAKDEEKLAVEGRLVSLTGDLALYTKLLFVSTAILALITLGLVVVGFLQVRDAKKSIDAAVKSAAAAEKSVTYVRNAERPYLTPFNPELRNWSKALMEALEFEVFEFHMDITNIGKGVGFIESYGIAHEINLRGSQGKQPFSIRNEFGRVQVRRDAKFVSEAPFDAFQIVPADRRAMIEFRKTLYVYGYVRYFDFFNVYRRTGFIFEFIPVSTEPEKSTFAICAHPLWNDEEEKQG